MSTVITERTLVLSEVLTLLRGMGCVNATPNRLHQLIASGTLPRPDKDGSGRLIYDRAFVATARVALLNLPSAKRHTTAAT